MLDVYIGAQNEQQIKHYDEAHSRDRIKQQMATHARRARSTKPSIKNKNDAANRREVGRAPPIPSKMIHAKKGRYAHRRDYRGNK